ncbi:MAG: hypothetical protein J6Z22_08320, partial [Lachnospiraceae bacterium]|nr:hypothetical protein [Lachnospiraceae bacterium]
GFENNLFGKGVMFGDSHGESQRFPFQIVQDDDDTYFVMIRNVLRAGNLLTMEINIDKDGFAATFQEELYGYEGSIFLRVTEDSAVITMNVQSGGKTIVTYETDCKCLQGATLGKTATILSLGATAQEEAEALGAVPGGKEERDSADAAQASKAVADEVPSNDASRWRCFVLPWGDKIFQTIGGDIDAQVLTVDRPDIKLSRGFVTRNIGQKNGEVFPYGCFAFELYERDTASEVRLLDMTYPRSSLYQEAFVGKVYRKRGSK